ncbi:hypothetical protein B1992_01660 [Pseudoxanthomonas broegbernensis]|uniref:Glutathione S-transferase n=1 Tax=Pseudoxanthomonas broegbernensis TaxID=83619 RepID=A0A7V8GQ64_9GAMM|nr:MAPEG family protein [Pseudoxanthomonas broegbernensis]KAF1688148.1 hypothetical protein B1992_01660 [Pseudoxanthomonas broegbernensis]MBB6065198.1 hypothetical protein [Pseudoxanthomonas broegbernensis]
MSPRASLAIAALHALLYLALSLSVVLRRRAARVGLGHGGDEVLARRVRAHANFGEYVPLALLLLSLLELSGTAAAGVWGYGLTLLAARLLHAWGLFGSAGVSTGRLMGTTLTWAVLLGAAVHGLLRAAGTV